MDSIPTHVFDFGAIISYYEAKEAKAAENIRERKAPMTGLIFSFRSGIRGKGFCKAEF